MDRTKEFEHHYKKAKSIRYMQMVAITLFFGTLFTIGVTILGYYFLESPKMYYKNSPFPVMSNKIYPGDVVPLLVERCNVDDELATYTVTRYLESIDGGRSVILPKTDVILEPGCKQGMSMINVVPVDTPPGHYRVGGRAYIHGTVKTFEVDWQSQPFEVLPTKKPCGKKK